MTKHMRPGRGHEGREDNREGRGGALILVIDRNCVHHGERVSRLDA